MVAWPSDAGAMGTAMMRRTYGESLDFVAGSTSEYHWLAGNAMTYAGAISPDAVFPRRVEYLDVDAHSTTAMLAPRAIFVTNGTDTPPGFGDAWADPRGCFLSGKLASPVWQLLGWSGQVIPPGTVFTGPGGDIPPGCTANRQRNRLAARRLSTLLSLTETLGGDGSMKGIRLFQIGHHSCFLLPGT